MRNDVESTCTISAGRDEIIERVMVVMAELVGYKKTAGTQQCSKSVVTLQETS